MRPLYWFPLELLGMRRSNLPQSGIPSGPLPIACPVPVPGSYHVPTARPSKEQQSTTQLVVTVDEHATVDGVAMRGAIPDMPKIFAAMLFGFFDFTYCSNCGVSRVTVRCSTELCRRTPSYEKKKN